MKLLTIDIENTPNVSFNWEAKAIYIPHKMMIQHRKMLCFAAKWHGDDHTYFYRGKGMVEKALEMMSEADALITYNGRRHDIPILNTEIKKAGLTPPPPPIHIDLIQTVRSQFKLYSNSLDYTCKYFGLPGKEESGGWETWQHIAMDEFIKDQGLKPPANPNLEPAWLLMEKYNRWDVEITEILYDFLLPWIPNHPNRGLFGEASAIFGEACCPRCGGTDLRPQGFTYTSSGRFQRYRCASCGRWSKHFSRDRSTETR